MVVVVVVVGRGVLKGGVTSVESNRIRGSSTSRELSAKPIGREGPLHCNTLLRGGMYCVIAL